MALLLEKPTACKDCQSRSISRKKRPFWLKLVTSNKRLYRCDICGWTVWVQGRATPSSGAEPQTGFPATESFATEFPATEFPATITQGASAEQTRPFVPDHTAAPAPAALALGHAPVQTAALSPAQRAGQQELSFDSD